MSNKSLPNIDRTVVGEKAYGLFTFIETATPPFIVITSNFYEEWVKDKNQAEILLVSVVKDICSLFESLKIDNLIIRSSAKVETYKERGNYFSSDGNITRESLFEEVVKVLEQNKDICSEFTNNSFSVIIQKYKKPKLAGHISNERRVSRNYDDWLIEYYDSEGSCKSSDRVKLKKDLITISDFECRNESKLQKILKEIPSYIYSILGKKRVHIEWVWDKHILQLLQCDIEEDIGNASNPGSEWNISNLKEKADELNMTILRLSSESRDGKWAKTECVQVFSSLKLPHGEIFILDNIETIKELNRGYVSDLLRGDLEQLLRCPIVIRTDLDNVEEQKRVLLPRTDTIFELDDAINYLLKNVKLFTEQSKIPIGHFCFLIHRFILSKSCALVLTKPNVKNKFRIDSTWGIVDGLYYHPHDSFEVTVENGVLKNDMKYIRCKSEYLDVKKDGKWFSKRSGSNYDWKESLTKKQRLIISQYTAKIAEHLKVPVVVMYFVDVDKSTGYSSIIPWFYTTDEVTENSERFSDAIFSNNYILIESKEDIEKLQNKVYDESQKYTLKLKPNDEIIRDKKIVEDIAQFSKENNIPVELEGSILAHPYYILKKNGVRVKCVNYFEPQYKVQSFNKLVRDKIPTNIESKGETTTTLEIEPQKRLHYLKKKAIEEALEFYWESADSAIIEELADLYEIIRSSCSIFNLKIEDIEMIANNKASSKGGFDSGVFLLDTKEASLINTIDIEPERGKSSLFNNEVIEKRINKIITKKSRDVYFDGSILHMPYINDVSSIKLPSHVAENQSLEITYKNKDIHIHFIKEKTKEDPAQLKIIFPEE